MATKKNYRANNTYLIEGNTGDNPKLMAQALNDGRDSLYLEFYMGYSIVESKNGNTYKKINRECERLGLYLWQAPRTPIERQENKDTLTLAKKIRFERGQQLLESVEGYRLRKNQNINFLDYYQAYIDRYTKKDKRNIELSLKRFKAFLKDTPEYTRFAQRITPQQINKEMVIAFTEYLQERSKGEGAHTLFARFKKVVASAVEDGVFIKNPCNKITIKIDRGVLKKDVLSQDEITKLIATHYPKENNNIRRAFIFCLYTGIRYCDVKDLTFANVDFANHLLKFEQNKTKGHSSNSGVVTPLNEGLLKLIGKPTTPDNRAEVIFPLPSYEMCLKAVKRWVKRAGIDKHISWHCARHSFAVNILNNGANIKTVASLLGHSGLKCTEIYTRAVDSLKQQAIDSLPALEID